MLINVHFCDVGQVGATTETELKEPVCQRPQGEGYFLFFFGRGDFRVYWLICVDKNAAFSRPQLPALLFCGGHSMFFLTLVDTPI
jgi:hypothetical protein